MARPKGVPQKRVLVPGKLRGQPPIAKATAVPLPAWAEGGVVVGVNRKLIKVRFPNGATFVGPKE